MGKFPVTWGGDTHSESGILGAGGGCLGGKSSPGLHHQTLPSLLQASLHQTNHLQETKMLFFRCVGKLANAKKSLYVNAIKYIVEETEDTQENKDSRN